MAEYSRDTTNRILGTKRNYVSYLEDIQEVHNEVHNEERVRMSRERVNQLFSIDIRWNTRTSTLSVPEQHEVLRYAEDLKEYYSQIGFTPTETRIRFNEDILWVETPEGPTVLGGRTTDDVYEFNHEALDRTLYIIYLLEELRLPE